MKATLIHTLFPLLLVVPGCRQQASSDVSACAHSVQESAISPNKPARGKQDPSSFNHTTFAESTMAMSANADDTGLHDDMTLIKGGMFLMGTDHGVTAERPAHQVNVKSFWIDRHAVTVTQFAKFVKATAYKTGAEILGWSGVFDLRAGQWKKVNGADWHHPEGPSSEVPSDEPVTQVSWYDAMAYAAWAKKRLPTEAEFEYAARGGLEEKEYGWGDDWCPNGKYMANCWQGTFPEFNTGADGFRGRAPVGSYRANGYGLYDMTGNVWAWCSDWFGETYYQASPRADPAGPVDGQDRVIRGGSWLCSSNYCLGLRVASRNHTAPDSGLNNLGFRCARNSEGK